MENKFEDEENLVRIEENGKIGFSTKDGKVVIPCKYDFTYRVYYGNELYYIVEMNNKNGVISDKGEEIIPCIYDRIQALRSDNKYIVCKDNKWGYIDRKGKEIIPCIYDSISTFYKGLAMVSIGGKRGVVDIKGKAYFDEKSVDVAKVYYERIEEKRTLIQQMIDASITKEEINSLILEGKKQMNHLRVQMSREMLGKQESIKNDDELNEIKNQAKESIEEF